MNIPTIISNRHDVWPNTAFKILCDIDHSLLHAFPSPVKPVRQTHLKASPGSVLKTLQYEPSEWQGTGSVWQGLGSGGAGGRVREAREGERRMGKK